MSRGLGDVYKRQGLSKGDLDCIIVAAGPGSFSALRVGLSTAKGLCASLGVPLISVNTMEIEAHKFQGLGFPICSVPVSYTHLRAHET